jgi:mono/diheme cytochrome c family protein
MAIWILVALWISIGIGVFLVAFRPGSRRGRGGPSRGARRASTLAILAASAVFGIALPAIVLATNGEDKQAEAPGGVDLNAGQINGRELYIENCATCHTLDATKSVGRVGPNLDELRPPAELVVNAIEDGRARGNGQMPADLVEGNDARDVASFVAAVAGR